MDSQKQSDKCSTSRPKRMQHYEEDAFLPSPQIHSVNTDVGSPIPHPSESASPPFLRDQCWFCAPAGRVPRMQMRESVAAGPSQAASSALTHHPASWEPTLVLGQSPMPPCLLTALTQTCSVHTEKGRRLRVGNSIEMGCVGPVRCHAPFHTLRHLAHA